MAAPPENPPSLLQAYAQWKKMQEEPPGATTGERRMTADVAKSSASAIARRIAGVASAAEIERRAHRKGVTRVAKSATRGVRPAAAVAAGYARYRRHGGSLSLAAWRRKLAEGGAQ